MSEESGSSRDSRDKDYSIYPEIHREDIDVQEQLGVGSFGSVFKGIWHQSPTTTRIVALKKVFMLEKEAEILSKIRHRNIIEFHGICKSDAGSDFYIVTEYASNGSLYDYLHKDTGNELDFSTVLRWATEIAAGIHYLHYDAVVTIIHRDLKSKNIVLDSNLHCKICDFGTSKDLTHSCTAPTWGGTAAWMSPEIINQNEGLTTATDVWSYGVVLWEQLSREVPYKDFSEFRIYTLITQQGVNLVIPDSCPPELANLMRGCWKMNPKERLTMKSILTELNAMGRCPNIRKQCQQFLDSEDWKQEIAKQKEDLEKVRKCLEKKKEMLETREKQLERRLKLEAAFFESAKDPPADVLQWSEHHTAYWLGQILRRPNNTELDFLPKVKANIFRHRITGARLLEMSQKDLEHIGVSKLGCRLELMRRVKEFKEAHNKFLHFPTLEQAQQFHLNMKLDKESQCSLNNSTTLVLLLGMYQRKSAITKFKFYVDSDWPDEEATCSSSKLIQTVCFSVLDDATNKPLNEPACYSGYGCFSMDWVTKDENVNRVKVIANVHYADSVTSPRNTELIAIVTNFDHPKNLIERTVEVQLKKITPPTPASARLHHVTSGLLRGAWQKKNAEMRHSITSHDMKSTLNIPEPPTFSLSGSPPEEDSPLVERANSNGSQPRRKHRRTRTKSHTDLVTSPAASPICHGGKSKWCWKSKPKQNLH